MHTTTDLHGILAALPQDLVRRMHQTLADRALFAIPGAEEDAFTAFLSVSGPLATAGHDFTYCGDCHLLGGHYATCPTRRRVEVAA